MDLRLLPPQDRYLSNKRVCDLEIEGNVEAWIKKTFNIRNEQKRKEIFSYIIPNKFFDLQGEICWSMTRGLWIKDPEENNGDETFTSYVYLQTRRDADKDASRTWWKRLEKDVDYILEGFLYLSLVIIVCVCCVCYRLDK
jgi:hypothetical protein